MASLNEVMLIGNLGDTPELKKTDKGLEYTKLSIATREVGKDKKEMTEWHKVTVWGKHAANCALYLKKGSLAFVEGKLKTSKYEKNGVTHYSTEIIASDVQFLSTNPTSSAAPAPQNYESLDGIDFGAIPF